YPFLRQFPPEAGQASDVSNRPCEASRETDFDRIPHAGKDDRYRSRRPLESGDAGVVIRDNYVNLELSEFHGERWEPVGPAFRPAVINRNVLALDVAELPQTLPEGIEQACARGRGDGSQVTNPPSLRRRLPG